MSGNFTIAAAHGQTLTTSTTHPWTLNGSGQTVTFGALGQDGTVLWSTPGGSLVTPFGGAYTVLVRAGTLRANDSSFGVLTQFAQQTIIRPAGTLDLAGVSAVVTGLAGGRPCHGQRCCRTVAGEWRKFQRRHWRTSVAASDQWI